MILTDEQITFLADFADKGIAEQKEIAKRNADVAAQMEAQANREAFIADLKAQKEQEIAQAIQEFDSKQEVEVASATPITLDIK